MKEWPKHPFRVTGRLIWLGGELVLAALSFAGQCAFRPEDGALAARALWLQRTCRRLQRIFGINSCVSGPNHEDSLSLNSARHSQWGFLLRGQLAITD